MRRGIDLGVRESPQRDVGVTVERVDGVDGGHSRRIGDVGHDGEHADLAPLLERVGHPDGGGIVPPQ